MNAQNEIKIVKLIKKIKLMDRKLSAHLDTSDLSDKTVRAAIRRDTNKIAALESDLSALVA